MIQVVLAILIVIGFLLIVRTLIWFSDHFPVVMFLLIMLLCVIAGLGTAYALAGKILTWFPR